MFNGLVGSRELILKRIEYTLNFFIRVTVSEICLGDFKFDIPHMPTSLLPIPPSSNIGNVNNKSIQ
jgi:hypothetical protein